MNSLVLYAKRQSPHRPISVEPMKHHTRMLSTANACRYRRTLIYAGRRGERPLADDRVAHDGKPAIARDRRRTACHAGIMRTSRAARASRPPIA